MARLQNYPWYAEAVRREAVRFGGLSEDKTGLVPSSVATLVGANTGTSMLVPDGQKPSIQRAVLVGVLTGSLVYISTRLIGKYLFGD